MKTSILEMALETLKNNVQELQKEVKELREEIAKKKVHICENRTERQNIKEKELDELLTIKKVQEILGVCYNTLQNSIVKKGLLTPKWLSARKVRFSKKELIEYINNLSKKPLKNGSYE